jgi:hypothetical protein
MKTSLQKSQGGQKIPFVDRRLTGKHKHHQEDNPCRILSLFSDWLSWILKLLCLLIHSTDLKNRVITYSTDLKNRVITYSTDLKTHMFFRVSIISTKTSLPSFEYPQKLLCLLPSIHHTIHTKTSLPSSLQYSFSTVQYRQRKRAQYSFSTVQYRLKKREQ